MSKIEWTDETWNPVTGCTPISEGCAHCYAARMAKRLAGRCGYPVAPHQFDVTLHPDRLLQPLYWRKPRMVFVCSMGDLFHPDVPDDYIHRVWCSMAQAQQHTYQLLTKRPERARAISNHYCWAWPNNVWLGVTAENQEQADERIPVLLQCPAAVRFVSCEPLLGPIRLDTLGASILSGGRWGHDVLDQKYQHIDWVICGGETGPGARPMHPDWARSLRDQCKAAGVPFFFKGWGEWSPDGTMLGKYAQVGSDGWVGNGAGPCGYGLDGHPSVIQMYRIGKARAGHLLDGVGHHEYPEVKG